ncbi:MAG TPA: UDP-N-acetylglucosamine 2-epimerase (non-hydrolyzing) [Ignavibacteria bacterium]
MKKIISVVGARPNFMKMAPIFKELLKYKNRINHLVVHTGQHFDANMSDIFFKQLEIQKPNILLNIGSCTPLGQISDIIKELEIVFLKEKPDLVLVYGDINSTLSASIVCSRLTVSGKKIKLAHVESGLRSFDNSMPEEINRIVTDSLSDYLFVTEPSGVKNLIKIGVSKNNIFYVGNTMIDSLKSNLLQAEKSNILSELCINDKSYFLLTLHRPSNVDNKINFISIINILIKIVNTFSKFDIVFPVHPRTVKMMNQFKFTDSLYDIKNLILTDPLNYFDFMKLMKHAKLVMTDSGGIQEETTFINIPCLTLRENTERPVTIEVGTNTLCGLNSNKILDSIGKIIKGKYKKGRIPKYWDGRSAKKIVDILLKKM